MHHIWLLIWPQNVNPKAKQCNFIQRVMILLQPWQELSNLQEKPEVNLKKPTKRKVACVSVDSAIQANKNSDQDLQDHRHYDNQAC